MSRAMEKLDLPWEREKCEPPHGFLDECFLLIHNRPPHTSLHCASLLRNHTLTKAICFAETFVTNKRCLSECAVFKICLGRALATLLHLFM